MSSEAPFEFRLEPGSRLEPGFVEAALVEFERPQVAAVCGARRAVRHASSVFDRIADLEARRRPGRLNGLLPNAMVRRDPGEADWIVFLDVPMVAIDERSRVIGDWIREGFEAGRRGGWGSVGRAAGILALPIAAVGLSLAFRTSWPLAALPPAAAFLAYEAGSREGWRAGDVESRFLLGAHRLLRPLPEALGRLSRLTAATPTPPADTPSRS